MTEDTIYPSPDCRDGEHHKCGGTGWNEPKATFTNCPCTCHTPNTQKG